MTTSDSWDTRPAQRPAAVRYAVAFSICMVGACALFAVLFGVMFLMCGAKAEAAPIVGGSCLLMVASAAFFAFAAHVIDNSAR